MESIIDFNGMKVYVSWEGNLAPNTEVSIWTQDPGLAMSIIQLFLDEKNKRNLWFQSGWLSDDECQHIVLSLADDNDWKGWSRQNILSFKK
jgi:hypothetical protein